MLKNNKELAVTREKIATFQDACKALKDNPNTDMQNSDSILQRSQVGRIKNTIAKLEDETKTYLALRDNNLCHIQGGNLDNLARILIQTRIAKGWSQSDLARAMEIEPQQIQRYEAADYEQASLVRLLEVVDGLDISLQVSIPHAIQKENNDLLKSPFASIENKIRQHGFFSMAL